MSLHKELAVASKDGVVNTWSLRGNSAAIASTVRYAGPIHSLLWTHENKILVTAGDTGAVEFRSTRKRIRRVPEGEADVLPYSISTVAINEANMTMVTGGDEGYIHYWDIAKSKKVHRPVTKTKFQGLFGAATQSVFSTRRDSVITADTSGHVYIHSLTTKQLAATLSSSSQTLRSIACSKRDQAVLAGAGDDGFVYVWDLFSRKLTNKLGGHKAPVTGVYFFERDILLSGGLDKQVRFADFRQAKCVGTTECDFPIACLDFDEEYHVMCGTTNGHVFIFDMRNRQRPIVNFDAKCNGAAITALQSQRPKGLNHSVTPAATRTQPSPDVRSNSTRRYEYSQADILSPVQGVGSRSVKHRESTAQNSFAVSPEAQGSPGIDGMLSPVGINLSTSTIGSLNQSVRVSDAHIALESTKPGTITPGPPLSKQTSQAPSPQVPRILVSSPADVPQRVEPESVVAEKSPVASHPSTARGLSDLTESQAVSNQQRVLLKGLIDDALFSFRKSIRQDISNLHLELIRQFHMQQVEFKQMIETVSGNYQKLSAEVRDLHSEFDQLKEDLLSS